MTAQTRLPQPREGITGTDRIDSDLLSLDEAAQSRRAMMVGTAAILNRACMVGNPAPVVKEIGERMRTPRVGDLVVETFRGIHQGMPEAFGILLEHRREWWHTDEEWARQRAEEGWGDDEERPTDDVWYVQYGPQAEDVCRWTNCMFIAVLTDPKEFSRRVGATLPTGGVEIRRGDLLADLADSGFSLRPES